MAQKFLEDNNVNWWRTPPESSDANPIENLWHELKEYMRREVKPQNKAELVKGITDFWNTVDKYKCRKYIRHLRKVLPKIIVTGCSYRILTIVIISCLTINLFLNFFKSISIIQPEYQIMYLKMGWFLH